MKIIYIFKRIPHHSAHSGYDQIVKYIPSKSLSQTVRKLIEKILITLPEGKLKQWTWVGGWYKNESLAKEIQLALNLPFRRGIYHYLYGEDDYHWSGYFPFRSGSRIVVTYHQPPDVFDKVIKDKTFINKADAIVVCGTNQIEYFERITGQENVYFIPHGIDTNFFIPCQDKNINKRFNTISVGWWLRDVDMIKRVIEKADKKALDIEFNIVTFPEYFEHYKGLKNVNLSSSISNNELKMKYQEADALLLPMQDCTANNTILEAMACGIPILTTDVGGVRDYVTEEFGIFAKPGSDEDLLNGIQFLKNDPSAREKMGTKAREKALEFCWEEVAKKMMGAYRQIW